MNKRMLAATAIAFALTGAVALAQSAGHSHGAHGQHSDHTTSAARDARQLVKYPDELRMHTLSNMRDHLQVLGELQSLLATGAFDKAAELAESRLGMSSLQLRGAHEVAKYMPKGMQDAGTAMHRSASRFARVATDASVSGDIKEPLKALSAVSQTCVACHAGYRLQ